MDKRLAKTHKRKVARARQGGSPSEPDLRTPEQVQAAREAGRSASGRSSTPNAANAAPNLRNNARRTTGSAAKTDV